jgi:NitT/TauT family transport system permease protein
LVATLISFVAGGFLAVIGYIIKPVAKFLNTIIAFIRTLPTMAVILLILIWTTPNVAPIIVAILVLLPMIYAQFSSALNGIDDGLINAIKVFNISKKDTFFNIYVPLVAPEVLLHFGANISFGIKLIVSAEVMAYTFSGLGGMMQLANVYVNTARLSALTIVAVLAGVVIELVLYHVFKNAFKWKRGEA